MNNTNVLADLKDIHYPEPISAWPLAFGWYLLIGLSVILLFGVVRFFYLRWQYQKRKKLIKKALDVLEQRYHEDPNDMTVFTDLSVWLKRLVLAYYPRKEVASLMGDDWLNFLDEIAGHATFTNDTGRLLLIVPYAKSTAPEAAALFVKINQMVEVLAKKPFVAFSQGD